MSNYFRGQFIRKAQKDAERKRVKERNAELLKEAAPKKKSTPKKKAVEE